jgi:hypothetical protein
VAFKGAVEESSEEEEEEDEGAEAQAAEAEEEQAAPDTEAVDDNEAGTAGPQLTIEDLRQSIQLVEVWRGEAAGGRLIKAGTEGAVRRRLAPYGLEAAAFRLLPVAAPSLIKACLQTAAVSKAHSRRMKHGKGFIATLSGAPMDCCYVKYGLPAAGCPPPLQAQVAVAPAWDARKAGGRTAMVVVRAVAAPGLPGPLLDLKVDLDLPPELGTLLKVGVLFCCF